MPDRRRLGIRTFLLALLLPSIAALLVLDSWNDYRAVSRLVQDAYDQALLEPAQALDDSVFLGPDGVPRLEAAFSVQSMFEATRPRHKYLHVDMRRDGGPSIRLLGSDDAFPLPPSAADGVAVFYDANYRDAPIRAVALQRTLTGIGGRTYVVLSQAAESVGVRRQAESDSWHQAFWSGARLIGVTALLLSLGVAWALRPLERLRRSLQARTPARLAPIDTRDVPPEVAPLVEAVNHHIAAHRRLLAEQSQFLADASHQLRTPLAIMLTQAGYAVREQAVEPMRESLHAIVVQLSRARRLSEQLLSMAHASELRAPPGDALSGSTGGAPCCDLNAIAREVVLQYLPLAREKQQDLGWIDARGEDVENEDASGFVVPVAADTGELHEALSNLLHNAIKYTPAHGRIVVAVRTVEDTGGLTAQALIRDTGPGIPVERREAVFERFGRHAGGTTDGMHASRTAEQRGAGLGLAIARAYARRNGGDIVLADGDAMPEIAGFAGIENTAPGLCAVLCIPSCT